MESFTRHTRSGSSQSTIETLCTVFFDFSFFFIGTAFKDGRKRKESCGETSLIEPMEKMLRVQSNS